MLAVQMSAGVPLGDAVQVSADATGSESVRRAAQHAIVGTAVPMNAQDRLKPSAANSLPPMVCWLLKRAKEHSTISTSQQLRVLADWYRDSALRRFRFWILWVPTAVTAVVGGGASLLYCFVLLPPLFDGLRQLVR
jgi:type II secretory pathway component PulF